MAGDVLSEITQTAEAWAIVAAVGLPVGAAAAAMAWRAGGVRALTRWRGGATVPNRFGLAVERFDLLFLTFHLVVLYAGSQVAPAVLAQIFAEVGWPEPAGRDARDVLMLRVLAASAVAVPLTAAAWFAAGWVCRRRPPLPDVATAAGRVAAGVAAFVVLHPLVMAVYLATVALTGAEGVHPLTSLWSAATPFERVVIGVHACLLAPVAEELIFRGYVVGWAGGRWYRPWVLLGLAAVMGVATQEAGPITFVLVLGVGLWLVLRLGRLARRFPARTVAGVYSTAALFAAVHSGVWPTPVPLFVLGLGLGYVAARTGGVLGCVVLHGLFNAVSVVVLLRCGAG